MRDCGTRTCASLIEVGPAYRCAHTGYALPRARNLPNFAGGLNDSALTASNRLGMKGTGQAGRIAARQTIMNAVLDALAPLGVDELDMPATSFRV
jgi:carbon-monoxide dehydrogenase large subunit